MSKLAKPYATFGGTEITCIQDASFRALVELLRYYCAGAINKEQGATDYNASLTFAAETDSALLDATAEGQTGALVVIFGGNTTGNEQITTDADCFVQTQEIGAAASGFITVRLTFEFSSVTRATAA